MSENLFNPQAPENDEAVNAENEKEVTAESSFESEVLQSIMPEESKNEEKNQQEEAAVHSEEKEEPMFSDAELYTPEEYHNTADDDGEIRAEAVNTPVQPVVQTPPAFNPYAPRAGQSDYHNNQVNPGYTNVNTNQTAQQPYRYQQSNAPYGQYTQNNSGYRYPQGGPVRNAPQKPERGKGKMVGIIVLAVCLAVAVIGIIAGISGKDSGTSIGEMTSVPTTQQAVQPTTQGPNIEISTTEPTGQVANSVFVADKVRPSVVGVMTYINGKLSGEGSGVLMSEKDGWTYIVTCAHVLNEKGVSYGVLFLDGTTLEAELVAYDERTDIGVVKVNKTGLPLAEFGDSGNLKIGEPVYAIGNPGGSEFFGSITNGIVSSIDRSISSKYTMTCIQHNAAINPGNSGGALVNTAGQVIGINSSKIASTDFEGMGFAVPTSIVTPIVDALILHGYVPNRPKLGIQYAPVSSYQLYSLVVSIKGLPQGSLVIAGISEDSSFANTDVQVGDLIIAVNGKDMTDSSVLLDMVETGAVGDTLTLTLCRIENRTYKTSTFDVTISLVEDKGSVQEEEPTTNYQDGYYYGGADSFEDFFNDFFAW